MSHPVYPVSSTSMSSSNHIRCWAALLWSITAANSISPLAQRSLRRRLWRQCYFSSLCFLTIEQQDLFHCFACQGNSSVTSFSRLVVWTLLSPTLYTRICFFLDALVPQYREVWNARLAFDRLYLDVSSAYQVQYTSFRRPLQFQPCSVHIFPATALVSTLSAVLCNMQMRHICYCPRMPSI